MQNDDRSDYKYVFVCGLHRSGTSMLGRNIARLENCTGFKNTGADMDEGQLLQDVYTIDTEFGGAGRFGFEPSTHRTETSELLTPENIARLRASWHSYWDKSKTICVEKTPGNLLMTRFLQAAFPNSYFIVVKRHPVPVSIASQRWKINITSLHSLFKHWLHCHELFEQDKNLSRVGYVFETKVGKGKLLVSTLRIRDNFDEAYPEAISLFDHLLRYATSQGFEPQFEVNKDRLQRLQVQ